MNEFIRAEKSRIGGMLAGYNKQVEDITNEMLGIDAKYKALAKKEKEALSSALSVLKDLIKGASKMYAMLGDDEEKTEEKVAAPVIPDEKTQVVDTLFPENNDTPVESENESEEQEESESDDTETVEEVTVEEEKDLDLGAMKQDDTVLEFEKEDEEMAEDLNEAIEEEEDEDKEEWDKLSQW